MQHLDQPDFGSVLLVSAWWLPASFWLLVIAGLVTSAYAALGSFPVYESGVGVLRSGIADLPASVANCSIESLNPAGAITTSLDAGSSPGAMYIAVLAGSERPKLAPGMRVLLRVENYPDAVIVARLESVGDRLLAHDDVRSVLPSLGAEASQFEGPFVSICGSLETDRFESGGVGYRLQDGMLARARVKVREERLVNRIVPRTR
jgi:hypothetical protein